MWHEGMIDGYKFTIKYFGEGSDFGIDGGRISKLHVMKNNKTFAAYDRGWDMKPTKEISQIYKQILKEYN